MKKMKTVEFQSDYGTVLIEVEDQKPTTRNFGASEKDIEKSEKQFNQSIDVLKNVSSSVISKLNETKDNLKPDEIEVKVGLKFSAELGAIIAKSSMEGNLEVTIKWKNDKTNG